MTESERLRRAHLLVDAGWNRVLHAVLAGLAHDVNGRSASLGAMAHLAEMDGGLPDGLGASIEAESERLATVADGLSLLVPDANQGLSPLFPADLVARAVELAALARSGTAEVVVEVPDATSVPPILAHEASVLRALTVLLHAPGEDANGGWTIHISGDPEEAVIRVNRGGPGESPTSVEPLGELISMDGGSVERSESEVVLRLPSLARARAEGR